MNETEAAQRLMAAGAVGVMEVTVTPAGVPCRTCGENVTYIPESQGGAWGSGWVHVATGKFLGSRDDSGLPHGAAPAPRCPKCKSTEYGSEDTPWGIAWDCRACGHHSYFSIGD